MRTLTAVVMEINGWGTNVSEELEIRGVKGERKSCYACPLARYILDETDADYVAILGDHAIRRNTLTLRDETEYFTKPVSDFIQRFDAGAYKFLEA